MTHIMQLVYKVATLLRVLVRGFLALAGIWLAGNGAWILLAGQGSSATHLAELSGILSVLACAAWQWTGIMERHHEAILEKHRSVTKKKAARHSKACASTPALQQRPGTTPAALVPQAG
jgi:hypothetical protein